MTAHDQPRINPGEIALKDDGWIAECQSLSPDRALRLIRIRTSWDALAVLFICSHLEETFWVTEKFHREAGNRAYAGNYEGEWKTVQRILEQNPQTPQEFLAVFLENHSPEDFFGNLKRFAKRVLRFRDSVLRDPHGPVRKAQRHRGYRDKGTLRPPHRPSVEPPEKVQREDRRRLIAHPLIRDSVEDSAGGDHLPAQL